MNESNIKHTNIFVNNEFPTLVYANRQDYGHARINRPMHGHDSLCELLLCYQGFGTYNLNDTSYPIQEGDLIYYNCGELHEVVSDSETEIGTYSFGFTDVHFHNMPVNHFILSNSPHVRPSRDKFPFFRQLCEEILDHYNSNPLEQFTVQMLGISLLILAAQMPAVPQEAFISHAASLLTARVKDYIDTHYTEPIQLEDIASALSCSVPYLSHTFKETTGYSPIQYAIRRRIGLAQTLLISSDYSATHIATLVGYDNTNYFNSLFTKIVGTTPIRYRKKYLESLHGERGQL